MLWCRTTDCNGRLIHLIFHPDNRNNPRSVLILSVLVSFVCDREMGEEANGCAFLKAHHRFGSTLGQSTEINFF